jgi:hypothetical protein
LHSDLIYSTAETIKLEKKLFFCSFHSVVSLSLVKYFFYVLPLASDPRYISSMICSLRKKNLYKNESGESVRRSEMRKCQVWKEELLSHHNLNANSKFWNSKIFFSLSSQLLQFKLKHSFLLCWTFIAQQWNIYINILVVGCCEEVKKYEIAEGENGAEKMLKGVSLGMFWACYLHLCDVDVTANKEWVSELERERERERVKKT